MAGSDRVLVLGLGNILLGDEGLGVRAVEALAAGHSLPEAVEVLDGGTLGLDLLPRLAEVDALLIVDAVRCGRPSGSLVRLEGEAIGASLAVKMSVHQVGLRELLAASTFQGTRPSHLVLWGMEPAVIDWGLDLSPPVAANLPLLVDSLAAELEGLCGR
jgi:hydrogenase maturation protease